MGAALGKDQKAAIRDAERFLVVWAAACLVVSALAVAVLDRPTGFLPTLVAYSSGAATLFLLQSVGDFRSARAILLAWGLCLLPAFIALWALDLEFTTLPGAVVVAVIQFAAAGMILWRFVRDGFR